VPNGDVRRKVLALACFLITKPSMSATRDEVIEAVWPDVDADAGANSINQTLFFLRRVLEPQYAEDLSANYVHHDSEIVWFDERLVDSRSRMCRRLIDGIARNPTEELQNRLAREYRGKFALDFSYEDWATDHREHLHASYLAVVEKAIAWKIARGEPAHAIAIARRALQIDPDVEHIEQLLVRAYHDAESHAAVGEQYAHYAAYLKTELGLDPPTLRDLLSDPLRSSNDR
jgi:DNA-binding SARP family transcriptional activator